jgi:capsular exopolysaccharide synthesis family protein
MAKGAENESSHSGGFPAPAARRDSGADLALSDRLHAADGRAVVLPPPTLSPTPNIAALLTMLHRRWLLALSLGLLGSTTVGIATWLLMSKTGTYTVQAMVHLASAPDSLLPRATPDFEKFAYFQMTQQTLVKSQVVLEAVLKDPEVASLGITRRAGAAKEWLAQGLKVDFPQGAEILRISMTGEEPDDLVVLVNAVMRTYVEKFVNTEEKKRKAKLAQLERLKSEHGKQLTAKQLALRASAPKLGVIDARSLTAFQEMQMQQLASAREQLGLRQEEKWGLEGKLKQLRRAKETHSVPAHLVDVEVDTDSVVKRYREQIEKLELHVAAIRNVSRPAQAEQILKKEGTLKVLEDTRAVLDQRMKEVRPTIAQRLRAKALADLDAEITETENRLAIAGEREKSLGKTLEELGREKGEVGKETLKTIELVRGVEDEEKIISKLADQIQALEMESLGESRATPLDNAIVTQTSSGKKRLALTGGASAATLGLLVFGVAFLEFRKRKIDSADEVIHGFGVGLVGTVPVVPRGMRRRGATLPGKALYNQWTESIDSYRMLLLRQVGTDSVRVVMVTSAMAGEGKSSLSSHLAVSLARAGYRTALVDTDLRNPTVHRIFALPRGPGLSDILNGASVAAQPTAVSGLYVIPSGDLDLSAVLSIARDDAGKLFERLKQEFDFVIVDSSPVLAVAGTLHIAQHVDGVILSILRNVSRMPKVSAAIARLEMVGASILGAVVNGSDEDVYSSRYHTPAVSVED